MIEIKFLARNFCITIFFCNHYFSPLNTFMIKGQDPNPDSSLRLTNPDADPGGLKTYGSGSGTLPRIRNLLCPVSDKL
jgi:hypothetical protein